MDSCDDTFIAMVLWSGHRPVRKYDSLAADYRLGGAGFLYRHEQVETQDIASLPDTTGTDVHSNMTSRVEAKRANGCRMRSSIPRKLRSIQGRITVSGIEERADRGAK